MTNIDSLRSSCYCFRSNIEALKEFNEIMKLYFYRHPDIDLTDFLCRVDSYSREMNGVPILMKSDTNFLKIIKEYIDVEENVAAVK